jgi:hypothetical protein
VGKESTALWGVFDLGGFIIAYHLVASHVAVVHVANRLRTSSLGDGEKAIELFSILLENANLEEVTMWQAGTPYRGLRTLLKGALDQALLTKEVQIQVESGLPKDLLLCSATFGDRRTGVLDYPQPLQRRI